MYTLMWKFLILFLSFAACNPVYFMTSRGVGVFRGDSDLTRADVECATEVFLDALPESLDSEKSLLAIVGITVRVRSEVFRCGIVDRAVGCIRVGVAPLIRIVVEDTLCSSAYHHELMHLVLYVNGKGLDPSHMLPEWDIIPVVEKYCERICE